MELKISKVHKENEENTHDSSQKIQQRKDEQSSQNISRKTVTFENGVSLHKQGERYFLSVGEQELEVTEEEALLVSEKHDYAFDLIMEKRGKFWFNASIDNVGLNRETI